MPRYDPDQVPRGARKAMLDRIRAGSTVLDVGCWSGFAGRYLRERAQAVVDGIEPDAEMAARAAESYREVRAERAEVAVGALLDEGRRYDALLFLDVLEHLPEPAEVLRAARGFGGRAYVSLPNVAHWSVRKSLLLGRFDYTESGLLDRTHLRFFTAASARRLLQETGWSIRWTAAALGPPPLLRLREDQLAPLGRWPGLFAVQLLFEAEAAA
jgi:SAM-dependent methyltransferase